MRSLGVLESRTAKALSSRALYTTARQRILLPFVFFLLSRDHLEVSQLILHSDNRLFALWLQDEDV